MTPEPEPEPSHAPPAPTIRFFVRAYVADANRKFATVHGLYSAPARLGPAELMARYESQARVEFARRGFPEAVPTTLTEGHHFQLPPNPRPSTEDSRPLQHWKLQADFVIHDIRFSTLLTAVFAWPEEPQGTVLRHMLDVALADRLAIRGDEPSYMERAEMRALKVEETDEAETYGDG